MWASYPSGAWLWPVTVVMAVAGAAAVFAVARARRPRPDQAGAAREILAQRLARGDIGDGEYRDRLAALRPRPARQQRWWRWAAPRRSGRRHRGGRGIAGAGRHKPPPAIPGPFRRCRRAGLYRPVPARPGRRRHIPGHAGHDGLLPWRNDGRGVLPGCRVCRPGRVDADDAAERQPLQRARRGDLLPRLQRRGLTYELVILPLPAGGAGSRPIGSGGTVSERGSLGEASATCAAGTGDGITAGAAGWVSLHLAPGRYELICSLPGHYAMGMHIELDVR